MKPGSPDVRRPHAVRPDAVRTGGWMRGWMDARMDDDSSISKAPQGNERGAMTSKNPFHTRTLVFLCSAWVSF